MMNTILRLLINSLINNVVKDIHNKLRLPEDQS